MDIAIIKEKGSALFKKYKYINKVIINAVNLQDTNGVITPTKKTLAYATTSAVGGLIVHSVNSGSVSVSSNGSNYYGVNRDKDGKAYVALPT